MLHSLAFEGELYKIKETEKFLAEMWEKYIIKEGSNYNIDILRMLQKISTFIIMVKEEHEEYLEYRNR